jgi:carboxymethylenebutenolidase
MKRTQSQRAGALVVLFFLTLLSGTRAHAQDWAKANLAKSPRHGEYVTIHEGNGRSLQAWVVYPESKGKAPVVVLIHEIFGLSDWAREMADEIAAAGYIVVEPDLLSGLGPGAGAAWDLQPPPAGRKAHLLQTSSQPPAPTSSNGCAPGPCLGSEPAHTHSVTGAPGMGCDPLPCSPGRGNPPFPQPQGSGQAGAPYAPAEPGGTAAFPDQGAVVRAVSSLPDPQVLADLDAASDFGKHLPSASGKLFVAGFCWGGGKSFLFATHRHDLSAAFVFYGPPPPAEAMKTITAAVYGFYAGNDARITSTVDVTRAAMKAAGKVYEPVVYDGAGHGFMRAGEAPDASAANAAARQAGFRRLLQTLGDVR